MAHLKPGCNKGLFTAMIFGLLLALLLALPNQVYGQGANATLLGTVTDATGAVLPNASVQVTNVATGVRQISLVLATSETYANSQHSISTFGDSPGRRCPVAARSMESER